MIKRILTGKRGQGLVEYALILVLVAIVVMIILAILGPAVGNIFSNIVAVIGGGGSNQVTGVSASYTPPSGPAQSKLEVTVYVSGTADVTISGSGSVSGHNPNCSGQCSFSFLGVPPSGTVTASGGGSSKSDSW